MRAGIILILIVGMSASGAWAAATPGTVTRWQGTVPEVGKEAQTWHALLKNLKTAKLPYGELAAASRILTYFQDLRSKEAAYRTVVDLIDQGYPGPTRSVFVPGDIEPHRDAGFVNSYNLYKYLINRDRGLDRWAQHYYRKVDLTGFPKFLFYSAVQSYAQGELDEAEEALKQALSQLSGSKNAALSRWVARTLARIHFEKKEYAQAIDIYQAFLLRMNPVQPSDWLEAASNLYYLNRHAEALGMLFNLESRAASEQVLLEKYTLRALIYRQTCRVDSAEAMSAGFERDFGATLKGLKKGEPAARFEVLRKLEVPGGSEFRQLTLTLAALQKEKAKGLSGVAPESRGLAGYLYDSEIEMLTRRLQSVSEAHVDRSARELLTVSEHLKFLKYDVAREKYNPDAVFRNEDVNVEPEVQVSRNQIHWPKSDEFWRNERLSFKGVTPQKCVN